MTENDQRYLAVTKYYTSKMR